MLEVSVGRTVNHVASAIFNSNGYDSPQRRVRLHHSFKFWES